jgi:molybdopterin-guanine dinucleotide biosynthesis protein A
MIAIKDITGLIIAGGKSTRMGSDKGLLIFNNRSFMSHIIAAVKPLVTDIIIVSNNSAYDQFGYKRVEDLIENAGPLAGLYSGLYHSKTKYNLVLSCDVPLINSLVLSQLIDEFEEEIDVIQIQSQNQTMPLIAIYKKDCFNKFKKLLLEGEKRLQIAVEQLNTKTIVIDSEMDRYVKNINTVKDLNEIQNAIED